MNRPVTVTLGMANDDPELAAIRHVADIIERFDSRARSRILGYLRDRYENDLMEVARLANARNS